MKRTAQALILGLMLLTVPVFAQDKPKTDTPPAPTAQVTSPAPVPAPTPTAPARDSKRPAKDIKFREF